MRLMGVNASSTVCDTAEINKASSCGAGAAALCFSLELCYILFILLLQVRRPQQELCLCVLEK